MKKKIIGLCAVLAALAVCGAALASAQPGDNSDPVVTKSYVDQVVTELKEYIAENGGGAAPAEPDLPASSGVSSNFQVLSVSSGQRITLGEGTELILRAGNAEIFSTERGGIADATSGQDLTDGASAPANHLLIVPRADGRGITAKTNSVIMIRGSYRVD